MQEDRENKASLGYVPTQKEQRICWETSRVGREHLSLLGGLLGCAGHS